MPFRRGPKYRKNTVSRKTIARRSKARRTVSAPPIRDVASSYRKYQRAELREFQLLIDDDAVTSGGVMYNLSLMAPGDADGFREGSSLQMCRLAWRGYIEPDAEKNIVRRIVFVDKSSCGAPPPLYTSASNEGLLDDDNATGILAPQAWKNKDRYTILADDTRQVFDLELSPELGGQSLYSQWVDIGDLDLSNFPRTTFLDTTPNTSALGTNQLYVVFLSDSALAPNPDCSYLFRLIYSP